MDSATLTTIDEDYVPIIEDLNREVPVPVGPVFVSPHGDTDHCVLSMLPRKPSRSETDD